MLKLFGKLVITFCLAIFVSNTTAADIQCFMLQLPEKPLPQVKKIAIMDFRGDYWAGKKVTDYLISALLQEKRGIREVKNYKLVVFYDKKKGLTFLKGARTNIFTIVERSQINKIFEEHKLSLSGLVSEADAARVGELLGVDAIITGTVRTNFEEFEKNEKVLRRKGLKIKKVIESCRTRKAEAHISLRIIDVNTGEIIGTKEASHSKKAKECGKDIAGMATRESLIEGCLMKLGTEDLPNYFSPYFDLVKFDLQNIKAKSFKKRGEEAKKLAKSGELDQAFSLYKCIQNEDPYNDRVHYNLGVIHAVVGNLEESINCFNTALKLKSDKKYKKYLKLCSNMLECANMLSELGVEIEPYEFNVTPCYEIAAKAKRIKLNGGSGDRIPIRTYSQSDSKIMVRVPGGLEVDMLGKEGDWYKVRLIDGKIGYVHKKDVKEST